MSTHVDRSPDSVQPDVSIILTVHNDAANLRNSVGSATGQTYRNVEILIVDDCSDDDSYDVAVELASDDERVSVLRTPSNSGGPGAPRNVGLEVARAPFVTFLDSDDLLEPAAVDAMLRAAVGDRVDMVVGMTRRVFLDTGETVDWYEDLFTAHRSVSSIMEMLDLVVVTTATGKLYRREFLLDNGLRFLEDLHYEDLVFSARVFSAASGISVVPARVYIWNVYPSGERKSITNRRDEQTNLGYRLRAYSMVLESAENSGHPGLIERYQQKFLEHDAKLYLKDLVNLDDTEAGRVLAMLDPALRRIPDDVFLRLDVLDRLLYALALLGSIEGVRELKPAIKGHVLLEGHTTSSEGRTLWRPTTALVQEPSRGSLEWRLLDITDDHILSTPFCDIAYAHRVSSIELASAERVLIRGTTTDPLGALSNQGVNPSASVVARLGGHDYEFCLPVHLREAGDQCLEWEFVLQIPSGIPFVRPMQFDMWLRVEKDGRTNASPMWLRKGTVVPRVVARSWLPPVLRECFSFRRVGAGRLVLRLREPRWRRGAVDRTLHSLGRVGGNESARQTASHP